jgi:hypothetical protein
MFAVGDIVEKYSMVEDRTYYGVVVSIHNNIYYSINWLDEQNPAFYHPNEMLHESTLKKV